MRSSRFLSSLIVIIGLLAVASASWAFPMFPAVVKTTYGIAADSKIAAQGCGLCHTSKNKGDQLNPFGTDLKSALTAAATRKLTKELLQQVEPLDSDRDGASNVEEIKADTLPGDAASIPVWSVATVTADGLDTLPAALAAATSRTLYAGTVKIAEVKLGVAGQNLALQAKVYDKKISPASSVELAVATSGAKTFQRLVLPQAGPVQLYLNADAQPAPAVSSKSTPLADGGYELVALIPLTALQIDPAGKGYVLEVAVTAAAAADADAQFASLFGSPCGYADTSKFGAIVLAPAAKPAQ